MFDKLCTQQIHLIEAVTLLSEYVQVQMQNGPGRYIRFSAWVEETERGNRKEIERGNRKREHKEEIEKNLSFSVSSSSCALPNGVDTHDFPPISVPGVLDQF